MSSRNKRKKWFSDPSTIISAFALLLSLFATSYSVIQNRSIQVEKNRSDLRTILAEAIDIDDKIIKAGDEFDSEMYTAIEVLISQVNDLEEKYSFDLTRREYIVMAELNGAYGDTNKTFYFDNLAVKCSKSKIEKVRALHKSAISHMCFGNSLDGLKKIEKAIETAKVPVSDLEKSVLVRCYFTLIKLHDRIGNSSDITSALGDVKSLISQVESKETINALNERYIKLIEEIEIKK